MTSSNKTGLSQDLMDLDVSDQNRRKRKRQRTIPEEFTRRFVQSILDDVPNISSSPENSEGFKKKWKRNLDDELLFFNRGLLISSLYGLLLNRYIFSLFFNQYFSKGRSGDWCPQGSPAGPPIK